MTAYTLKTNCSPLPRDFRNKRDIIPSGVTECVFGVLRAAIPKENGNISLKYFTLNFVPRLSGGGGRGQQKRSTEMWPLFPAVVA